MKNWFRKNGSTQTFIPQQVGDGALISFRDVSKVYRTDAGDFPALKSINLEIGYGEFVSVIGKSGSGKTTLINMLTGIDRPSQGEIVISGMPIHELNESDMARWRGLNMGVVFQFFQLLPTISVLQNVMIPMDFCNRYEAAERKERAMHLLDLMDIADHAHKPPSRLSGGQQQRAAIARALANDPPIIATDEPTGNLDSKTANQIFDLFSTLVSEGKTILMVTHDDDLAKRASRTVIISDGEIVNEYLARALPSLPHEILMKATRQLTPIDFAPGQPIIQQGDEPDRFYILTDGKADVYLNQPRGKEIYVDSLEVGQFFGEMALLRGRTRSAQVRAGLDNPVQALALDKEAFFELLEESSEMRAELEDRAEERQRNMELARTGLDRL
jgi:ABC-type lipoprotein export system ATPase subunit